MFSMFGDEHEPSSTQDLSLGAFSIQTPTIGPVTTELSNTDSSKDATDKPPNQQPRRSPRLTPLFQSPVFTLNTPVIGCASLPTAFSIADTSRTDGESRPVSYSPMVFIDSPMGKSPSVSSLKRTMSVGMAPPLGLGPVRGDSSVLERFKRFFEHQRIEGASNDAQTALDECLPSPPDTSMVPIAPLAPEPDHSSSGSSAPSDQECTVNLPGSSANASRQGSSCHQCKSRRVHSDLSFCVPTKPQGRKGCRKKYCGACLTKFYAKQPPKQKSGKQSPWTCPSCEGLCCCAACRRSKEKKQGEIRRQATPSSASSPQVMSPATSMAVGMVYFGDTLEEDPPSCIREAVLMARNHLQQSQQEQQEQESSDELNAEGNGVSWTHTSSAKRARLSAA